MPRRLNIKEFIKTKKTISIDTDTKSILHSMQTNSYNAVAVVENKKVLGIITERDILKLTSSKAIFKNETASDIMTSPAHTIKENQDYRDAYLKMSSLEIRHLVVVNEENEYVGIISEDELFLKLEYNQFLSLKSIEELMSKDVYSVNPEDKLGLALEIMADHTISSIIIVEDSHPMGILTEKDIISLISSGEDILTHPIKDYMTTPIKVISKDHTLIEVEKIMKDNHFRHIVVVDSENVIEGVITQHDLIKGIPTAYVDYLRRSLKNKEHKLKTINEKIFYDYALGSLKNYLIMVIDKRNQVYYINNEAILNKCNLEINHHDDIGLHNNHKLFEITHNFSKASNKEENKFYQEIEISLNKRKSIHLSTEIIPIYELDKYKGYIFIAHDVTSSVIAQQEKEEERTKLLQAQTLAKLCSWELNLKSRVFNCSPYMYDMLYIENDSVITLDMLKDRISEDSYKKLKALVKKCIDNEKEYSLVFKLLDYSNNTIWVEARININRRNKEYEVFGTLQDITLRKKREDEINRFKYIVSSINDLVVFLDKDCNYLFANKAYLDFFSTTEEELLELNVKDLVGDERFNKEFKPKIEQTFKGETVKFERVYVKSEEETITLQVAYYPYYNSKNEITGLVGILQDITNEKKSIKRIEESEMRYRTLFENSKGVMLLIDPIDGTIVNANKSAVDFYGYSIKELKKLKISDINTLTKNEIAREIESVRLGEKEVLNFRHRLKDGSIKDVEVRSGPMNLDGRELLYSIIHDITKRRHAEQQLNLWASVIKNTNEGVVITDNRNNILDVNPAFSKITGYSLSEVKGIKPNILASGRHDESFYKKMWESIDELNSWQGELWNKKKDGTIYPEWININKLVDYDGNVTNYVAVFSDITLIKSSEESLFHIAHHDILTNLPNRMMLHSQIEYLIKNSQRHDSKFAVLFLDLDNFKMVNDTLGHSYGDEVIKLIAKKLQNTIRGNDMIARVGGDEFIIVLEDIHCEFDIERVCENILKFFEKPLLIGKREFNLGVSIGISIFPDNGNNVEYLIKNSDAAMYHAKNSGKNTFKYYSDDMTKNMVKKLKMDSELRNAIANKEFIIHYQPQVLMKDSSVFCLEALIRWEHPTKGLLYPGEFMSNLEESKLIVPLGEKILLSACIQLKQLHDFGIYKGCVAVNISAIQVDYGDIINSVKNALMISGLEAKYLQLELTENYIMKNAEQSTKMLNEIKSLGVSLAIDDFGTGYSSLSYLKKFPIDRLKIDISFVKNIVNDNSDEKIAKAIIDLGLNMNMNVIAEGIETQEQADILIKNGCEEGQGFLYSKALSADDFQKWYKSRETRV